MIVNPGSGAGKNGAPAKHAAQHGKNGTDPVTPASIGAAEEDHTHTAAEVGAAPSGHTHTAGDVGAAAANHTHTPASIGAAAANHTHTPASIGAAASSHSHSGYASTSHTHTAADVGALPSSGGTLTGDLRIKGSGNFGTKINLGDGDYVHISEPTDDCMEIKAKKINFVTTDTSDEKFTLNGEKIGGGASVEPAATAPKAPGTAAAGTSAKYAREDHVHPSQTSVSGNAGSATKLATARTIDGVSFNGSAAITHYGTCATAAATAAKVVSLTGFSLVTGAIIAVKFTYANTAASPTLNVNSTGAKSIKKYGTTAVDTNAWSAGAVVFFVYDGTNWLMQNGPPSVTQATPSITVSSAGLITASATQTAGLVPAGTKSATKQLTTQAAQTITPGTANKTIASGKYLTGTQTIKGDASLIAGNIKSGISIFGVAGTLSGKTVKSFWRTADGGTFTFGATSRITLPGEFEYIFGSIELATASGDKIGVLSVGGSYNLLMAERGSGASAFEVQRSISNGNTILTISGLNSYFTGMTGRELFGV